MMFKAASIKLGLDYAVMHNMHGQGGASVEGMTTDRADHVSALSKKELENLLRHGAYDIFREEKEGQSIEESNKFCEADIDQILSRSAVIIHDGKKSGAMQASATSFSKASFVVSGGATNDVAIDDPDFWTKVVGLSKGMDGLEDGIVRKRKCRDVFTSYKEDPTKGKGKEPDTSDASSDSESDDEDDEDGEDENDQMGGRKVKKKNVDGQGVADWTEANLNRILSAMMCIGYGNWSAVREDAKLRKWPLGDVARGGRIVLLQLLHLASINVTRHVGSQASVLAEAAARLRGEAVAIAATAAGTTTATATATTTATTTAPGTATASSSSAGSNTNPNAPPTALSDLDCHLRVSEDMFFLEGHLRRHKACRLALYSLQRDLFTPSPTAVNVPLTRCKAPNDGEIPENILFAAAVRTASMSPTGVNTASGVNTATGTNAATATATGTGTGKLVLPMPFSAVYGGVNVLSVDRYFSSATARLPVMQETTITSESSSSSSSKEEGSSKEDSTSIEKSILTQVDLYSRPHGLVSTLRGCGLTVLGMYGKIHTVSEKTGLMRQVRKKIV